MQTKRDTAEQWLKQTNNHITESYGLTEASPCVTATSYEQKQFSGNVGLPLPSTLVMITDKHGNPKPIGEIGEVCVNGPQVMRGYWQGQKSTTQVAEQRWLKTGDMGNFDEQGNLHIVNDSHIADNCPKLETSTLLRLELIDT